MSEKNMTIAGMCTAAHSMTKALFLDRDGTINVNYGYVHEPSRFHFIDGIFELCKNAQAQGYKLIVISNQSGVARGYYTLEQMNRCNAYMCAEFAKRGVVIDDVLCCTAVDDADPDRKPNPGLFLKAIARHGIDPDRSVAIGDSDRDTAAARASGVRRVYQLGTGACAVLPCKI